MHSLHAVAFSSAVAAGVYLSSLDCDFVFDDALAIVNNPDVAPHAPLAGLLAHDFWGKALDKEDSHKSYRPLTVLSFRVHTWWTNRRAAPRYFHAVNTVLHAAATACVAALGAWLWPHGRGSSAGIGRGLRRRPRPRVALMAGLLFAVHPVHVEAVTGVVGRAELLCALWCFACAAAYSGCASRWPTVARGGVLLPLARTGMGVSVAALFALAVLSKETGVTLLGVLGVTELIVHLPRGARRLGAGGALRRNLAGSAARWALLCVCACAYALVRAVLMRPGGAPLSLSVASLATSELIRRAENPLAFVSGRGRWLLSVGRVNVEYVRLLLWPATLCIEYSYNCVPLAVEEDLAVWGNAPPMLLLIASAPMGLAAMRNARRSAHARRTLVASAWLMMPWLPISHIPLRLGTLVAERTLYLPSVGAALLVANAMRPWYSEYQPSEPQRTASSTARAGGGFIARARVGLVVSGVVGLLAARTLRRTLDWRTDESAFESAIVACPRSAKLHQNMCVLRTGQRRLAEARMHCDLAEQIDPDYCDTAKSRAFVHLAADDLGRAIVDFNSSLTCIYTNVHAYRVLLVLYDLLHSRDAHNASLHEDMASTHLAVGNLAYAAVLLREASALHLRHGSHKQALAAAELGLAVVQKSTAESAAAGSALSPQSASTEAASGEACALAYWRGQALRAARRWQAATRAFRAATPCALHPRLGAAAAAEASHLEVFLSERWRASMMAW